MEEAGEEPVELPPWKPAPVEPAPEPEPVDEAPAPLLLERVAEDMVPLRDMDIMPVPVAAPAEVELRMDGMVADP